MYDVIEVPRLARPAFVGWQSSDRAQNFPTDRVADAARERRLRAEGRIIVHRRPAAKAAA